MEGAIIPMFIYSYMLFFHIETWNTLKYIIFMLKQVRINTEDQPVHLMVDE